MSALWVLPLVVLAAGAVGAAHLTRRLAGEVAALRREATGVRELVAAAEAARAEATALVERGVDVEALRGRAAALRRLPAAGLGGGRR